ncbi:DEAD/DEAH box helicase family protein, partial [Candidatus Bathyarchaeota archaeon]|nr:DEAD/DEAH box helicase family protein [Candidatus Bathyarchaeota archaeon]
MDDYLDDDIDDDELMLAADEALNAASSTPSIPQQSQQQPGQLSFAHPSRAESGISPPQPRPARPLQRVISIPRQNLFGQLSQGQNRRQATLDGGAIDDEDFERSLGSAPRGVYRSDNTEAPTHHELDHEELKTWVYPTNLGAIRDYQYSIVSNSLFNNTLVALPTGLGKTFIAATVMLNFYRWTKSAQIVFVAPTKPLVSQQVGACFDIVGIPRSDTTLLTGEVSPGLRAEEWGTKRVFFMTPQTLHNDLCSGFADPKRIALLVVDEAHRATGEYAYAKVVKFIRRFSKSIRILALTATPGSKIETVQEVIDNMGISHMEIRTEESMDIREYVHRRDVEIEVLDPSDEILQIGDLFTKVLQPMVDKMSAQNIYWGRDPMSITTYGLVMAQQEWFKSAGRHANQGLQSM